MPMQSTRPDAGMTEWRRRAASAWKLVAAAAAIHALTFLLAVIGPAIPWITLTFFGSYVPPSGPTTTGTITVTASAMRVRGRASTATPRRARTWALADFA